LAGIEADDLRAGRYEAAYTVEGHRVAINVRGEFDLEWAVMPVADLPALRSRLIEVCARLSLSSSPDDPSAVAAELIPRSRTRLLFRAEAGADSPLWTDRGHLLDPASLGLPADLTEQLQAWVAVAEYSDDHEVVARGRQLCRVCAEALQDRYEVLWDPDNDE